MRNSTAETKEADEKRKREIASDPKVAKELDWADTDKEVRIHPAMKHLESSHVWCIIVDGLNVGQIELHAWTRCRTRYDIGYFVDRDYWRKGICTEALKKWSR